MNRIQIFEQDDTTFVKDGAFVFPSFDGAPKFKFDPAMIAIGARKIDRKTNSWNVPFMATELAEYLSELQQSEVPQNLASSRWIRKKCVSQVMSSSKIPYLGGKIDWQQVEKMVEFIVSSSFPLCV